MSFKRLRLHIKNEEGSGLVLALMTLLVLSVLGASLGAVTVGSFKLGDVNRDDTSSYYIAEAGANIAYEEMKAGVFALKNNSGLSSFFESNDGVEGLIEEIETSLNENRDEFGNPIYSFENQFGNNPRITIDISENNNKSSNSNTREYIIESIGKIEGKNRTVRKPFEITLNEESSNITEPIPSMPINTAIMFKNTLSFSNHTEVTGLIKYNETIGEIINYEKLEHEGIDNKKILKEPIDWTPYIRLIDNFPEVPEYSDYETNNFDGNTLLLENNSYIEELRINEYDTLTIDTNGKTVFLLVDDFIMESHSDLDIRGDGKVNIYIQNEMSLSNHVDINEMGHINQVNLLYSSFKNVNLPNHILVNGSFFSQNKESKLTINNHVSFNGTIITGGEEIDIHNHSELSSVIISPYADVNLSNHAEVNGSIIAKDIELDNHAEIHWKNTNFDKYPFDPPSTNESESEYEVIISSEPAIETN